MKSKPGILDALIMNGYFKKVNSKILSTCFWKDSDMHQQYNRVNIYRGAKCLKNGNALEYDIMANGYYDKRKQCAKCKK